MLTRARRWLGDRLRGGYVHDGTARVPISHADWRSARTARHLDDELRGASVGVVHVLNHPTRGRTFLASTGPARDDPTPGDPLKGDQTGTTARSESAAQEIGLADSVGLTIDDAVERVRDGRLHPLGRHGSDSATTDEAAQPEPLVPACGTDGVDDLPFGDLEEVGDGEAHGITGGAGVDGVAADHRADRRAALRRVSERMIDPRSPRGRQLARERAANIPRNIPEPS